MSVFTTWRLTRRVLHLASPLQSLPSRLRIQNYIGTGGVEWRIVGVRSELCYHRVRRAELQGASCFLVRWGPLPSSQKLYFGMGRLDFDSLLCGSWIIYSFLHSFGLVMWAGINGYMNVSKFGLHHCASVSAISQSPFTPSPENCFPMGAKRSFSRALKPSISSSSGFR